MEEIFALSLEVNEFLRGYVRIHDHLFRRSMRHIIPLPFIFKAIEFDKLLSALETVSEGLEHCADRTLRMTASCTGEQREYLNLLYEYLRSLIITVDLLEPVLSGLHSKTQSWRRYGWRTYRSDVAKYQLSTTAYVALGGPLNEKLRALSDRMWS